MEAATLSANARSEFRNDSGGHVGVIVIEQGKEKARAVAPGDKVLLTAAEQVLTANAPKREKDNPFENGSLTLTTPARDIANRRPIGDASVLPGATQADPEKAERERQEREAKAAEAKKAQEAREVEAKQQAETGSQPRRPKPPAKSEGEGAVAEPPQETAAKPQPASDVQGERAAEEETGA
jgi:hypothetical protein